MCAVFSDTYKMRKLQFAFVFHEVYELAYGVKQASLKTRQGCLEYCTDTANGAYWTTVQASLVNASSASDLGRAGFEPIDDADRLCEAGLAEEDFLANRALLYILALAGQHLRVFKVFSHACPGMLFRLINIDPDVVTDCLKYLKRLWAYVCEIENNARLLGGRWAAFARWFIAFHNVWFRETMIELLEVDFAGVPCYVHVAIVLAASGWVTTNMNEEGFRIMRAAEGNNTNGKVARYERYLQLLASPLMENFW